MPHDFGAFLRESLTELQRTEPEVDRALRGALGKLRARLTSEAASFIIACEGLNWRISDDASDADVEIAFDDNIVLDLVDGKLTLNEAIAGERFHILGAIDSVAKFYDALLIYLEGLNRARGTPDLLERYRASAIAT